MVKKKPDCSKCRHHYMRNGDAICRCGFSPFNGFLNSFIPPMPYYCIAEADKIYPLEIKHFNSNFSEQLFFNFDF